MFTEADQWSIEEIEAYHQALNKYDKDFYSIAKSVWLCNTHNNVHALQVYILCTFILIFLLWEDRLTNLPQKMYM